MHKAWRSIEEVPYCFSKSSIKFHGHTGRKIDDLNPIWDYLAGRSYQIPQICLVYLDMSTVYHPAICWSDMNFMYFRLCCFSMKSLICYLKKIEKNSVSEGLNILYIDIIQSCFMKCYCAVHISIQAKYSEMHFDVYIHILSVQIMKCQILHVRTYL